MSNRLLAAKIGAAHGIKGDVKLYIYLEEAENVKRYSPLFDSKGKAFHVTSFKVIGKSPVVSFKDITDRNVAETLNGVELYIDKNKLPALDEDEFYEQDLIGYAAFADKQKIGKVIGFHNYGASDIIEIKLENGEEIMLPFTNNFIGEIDDEKQSVEIFLPYEGEDEANNNGK